MPLGTIYTPDIVSMVVNGVVANVKSTDIVATVGDGNYVTPTASFSVDHNGATITGTKGQPIPVDAGTKAFLLANAPVQ